MNDPLGQLKVLRKTGTERFHAHGADLGVDLQRFWQWASSDLVSNATRGLLAEFLVARALEIDEPGVRSEWNPYDLTSQSGIKVEVKASAYIQSWFQRKLSPIKFDIEPKRYWDASTNVTAAEPKRHADVYVFALLAHEDKLTVDPMDVDQWLFYVVPTRVLDAQHGSQASVSLKALKTLCEPVRFADLAAKIEAVEHRTPE